MSQLTKRAISASLQRLLLKKPFSKITINDIAEDCGISRMTFYYHFRDIYDLVEWMLEDEIVPLLSSPDLHEGNPQKMLQFFDMLQKSKPMIVNMYRSVPRERMENYLYGLIERLLAPYVEQQASGMDISEGDKQFIVDFCKYAFVGIILNWIQNGMTEDPNEIVARLNTLAQGGILHALEKFRTEA